MDDNQHWTQEAEEKEKKARRIAIVIIVFVALMLMLVFGVMSAVMIGVFQGAKEQGAKERMPAVTMTAEQEVKQQTAGNTVNKKESADTLDKRLAYIEEKKRMTEHLGTAYELVYEVAANSSSCVAKKNGKWGMVAMDGEVLVPFKYERVTCMDNTGWVEFQTDTCYAVYDATGKRVRSYEDKFEGRLESEEAYLYRTAVAYMSGMLVKTILPENPEHDFYGVEFYNWETRELLYRAVGGEDEVGIFTFPDENGRAVAIQNHATSATIYYITEEGCESREIQLPEGINYRWFGLPGHYTWADIALSNGWLKVDITDAVPGFLMDEYEYYTAFLNVDTLELVRFPEDYQEDFWIYDIGHGDTMAIASSMEKEAGYSVCKGSQKLTEENYYWVVFDDLYITACAEEWVEILDYSGNLKAKYVDAGGRFINGKMLVYDGAGVYLVNEKLEKCSEYLVKGQIDRCFSRGIVIDGWYYLISELAE